MIRSILQRHIRGIQRTSLASISQPSFNHHSNPSIATPFFKSLHTSPILNHGHLHKPKPGEELHITFITKDGKQYTYEVAEGDNILDIAQANNLDMEGACGGSCACSTCHIIVDPEFYDEIPEPSDDENDMLDLAFGLTETSRLGCQVKMSKELDGIRVALPAMTRNLQNKDFN
ncbi:Yah1 protein [Candida orthopsilosis Co 90-125]|uniref:Yah1 protein n=1 Tax=Candida orthopsilosis (strain 90-125) TaxID=1136231 RepID=H8X1D1_CANO9|nr:Yah1 protein [Candida orthopsilosis Co 90-125]CCG22171.1 Yah1 protein [Candida orthopsilosis Co 90-125]